MWRIANGRSGKSRVSESFDAVITGATWDAAFMSVSPLFVE
jgi:hypothetical protein